MYNNQETKKNQEGKMNKYEVTVSIPRWKVDRINRLLAIKSMEDITDSELVELGANTDQNEGIYSVTFDNGSTLRFELCSGQNNYWDDVVWTNPDKSRDVTLDCEYEIGDIEVEIESELYIVKLQIEEGTPFGVICYHHPEIDHTEEVLFESEAAMKAYLAESLNGGFDVNHVWTYVPSVEVAGRLAAMVKDITGSYLCMYKI